MLGGDFLSLKIGWKKEEVMWLFYAFGLMSLPLAAFLAAFYCLIGGLLAFGAGYQNGSGKSGIIRQSLLGLLTFLIVYYGANLFNESLPGLPSSLALKLAFVAAMVLIPYQLGFCIGDNHRKKGFA